MLRAVGKRRGVEEDAKEEAKGGRLHQVSRHLLALLTLSSAGPAVLLTVAERPKFFNELDCSLSSTIQPLSHCPIIPFLNGHQNTMVLYPHYPTIPDNDKYTVPTPAHSQLGDREVLGLLW